MTVLRSRAVRISSTLAAASLAAAALLGPGAASQSASADDHSMSTASRPVTAHELRFHDQMRRLWEDHVLWTRLAIVTFAGGSAGFDRTAARLLRNQVDIGNAFKPFYGQKVGNRLTALLHDHITTAVELLQAAKSGDQAGVADASKRWYANARQIADFVSSLDRHVWPRADMRAMMKTHLDQTLAEAVDELTGHYLGSVREYRMIERHILHMADSLSDGIIQQFPARFSR